MTETEVLSVILALLEKKGKGKVPPDVDLVRTGILDSIETIDFIVEVEKKFNVKMSEQDFHEQNLETIPNLVSFLLKNQ